MFICEPLPRSSTIQPGPRSSTRTLLEPYYDLAQDMMESRPLQPPVGRQALPPRTQVFLDAARRASYPAEQVDIAVYTGKDRNHPGRRRTSECLYLLRQLSFWLSSTRQEYPGYQLSGSGPTTSRCPGLPTPRGPVYPPGKTIPTGWTLLGSARTPGDPDTTGHVRATNVIVSAGTLGSSQLLLACRDQHGTLPDLSPALGNRFSTNGELLLAGSPGYYPSCGRWRRASNHSQGHCPRWAKSGHCPGPGIARPVILVYGRCVPTPGW